MRLFLASAAYFLFVFGVGFLLGPIRVIWLEPRLGPVLATLCEAPFLLLAIVCAAQWVPKSMRMTLDLRSSLTVGLGALVMQQLADFGIGLGIRGISVSQQIAHFATPEGAIYTALLLIFALMPAALNRR
jgi:hypothetical protein